MGQPADSVQCLCTSLPPQMDELYRHTETLWQMDTVPQREVTRSTNGSDMVKTGPTSGFMLDA